MKHVYIAIGLPSCTRRFLSIHVLIISHIQRYLDASATDNSKYCGKGKTKVRKCSVFNTFNFSYVNSTYFVNPFIKSFSAAKVLVALKLGLVGHVLYACQFQSVKCTKAGASAVRLICMSVSKC